MNHLKKWTTVFFSHEGVAYRGLVIEEYEYFYRVLLRRKLVDNKIFIYAATRYFLVRKENTRTS